MNIKQFKNNDLVDASFYIVNSEVNLPEALSKKITTMVSQERFSFKPKTTKVFYNDTDDVIIAFDNLKNNPSDYVSLRHSVNKIMDIVKEEKYKTIKIFTDLKFDEYKYSKVLSEMLTQATYEFNSYKSDKKDSTLQNVLLEGLYSEKGVSEGILIGNNVNIAKSLVDEPSISMDPETLAKNAVKLGKENNYEVEVKNISEIKELGMNAFLAVGQGSIKEPKLIIARYKGNKDSDEILGLVGKGLTYDSGGYSIKPTNSMITMKCDMAGAAAVLSTINLIAQAKLKINVTAVVAACENLISGNAYKPGDIVKTMKGKTIFIGNTDAEGRVTLVDSIYYTVTKENVSKVIDLATLTGAAIVSLGDLCAATFTNNQDFLNEYHSAALDSDEAVWQLPLQDCYRDDIKHNEADFINTASLVGGTPGSAAGAFLLEEFTEGKDWIHVDIAGPAHFGRDRGFYKKGASGYGVRTLYEFAKTISK